MKIKNERGYIIDVSEEEAIQRLRKRNAEDIAVEGLIKDREETIKFLKQQLAEKEKDFKDAEQCAIDYQDRNTELEQEVKQFKGLLDLEVEYRNKLINSQNQIAIAELEKVKDFIVKSDIATERKTLTVRFVDQQIKELKGEK